MTQFSMGHQTMAGNQQQVIQMGFTSVISC